MSKTEELIIKNYLGLKLENQTKLIDYLYLLMAQEKDEQIKLNEVSK